MKIIFLNRFFYPDHSATAQLLSDLAFDLAGHGHEVVVITSRQRIDDPKAELPSRESVHGVAVRRVWTTKSGRTSIIGRALDYLTFYCSASWRLFRDCAAGDIVIAKTDPPLLSIPCAWITSIRRAQLINWLHDLFPEVAQRLGIQGTSGPIARLLIALRSTSLKKARANVVLGERMAAVLSSEGIDDADIRIIHNWADGELIRPVPRDENKLRQEWALGDQFVVMHSGNLGRAHEFETMLAAAETLRDRMDIRFVVVGEGVQRHWLEKEVTRRGLNNVLLKPYQPREQLSQSLGAADVHLISLRPALEGLIVPSKFYGIAAAGRPAIYIGSADGDIPRMLAEVNCGVTVANGDGEKLAEHIATLADSPGIGEDMGKNARQILEHRFDKRVALAAWRDVIGV